MSVEFVIVPIIWPYLLSGAAAAASAMGFKLCQKSESISESGSTNYVEVDLQENEVLEDKLKQQDSFFLVRDDVSIKFYVNSYGKFIMHVSGENKTEKELKEIGTQVYNKIKQAYAYSKVTTELKKRGFIISEEKVSPEGTIKLKLTKFN
jgi:hypothetical protein